MSNAVETGAIASGKAAAYGGAVGAVVSGLTISEWGVIGGLIIGVMGWFCTQYWSWRKTKREEREMEIRMAHEFGTEWDKV
ncbi:hypothetical protein [Comamonas sp. MYb396]|uniref:hypothetical protein n=1 Tax=Comamonas sp. MYb396 TaxID=2745302 RepID=UPI00309B3086